MTATVFSTHAVILEQRERNKNSSKANIERFIEESESKLAALESQISPALVEIRDHERTCVAALRDLIAPIHTLPVELLAKIFHLAIPSGHNYDHFTFEDVFRISQVCSHWRQVAIGTPRLWTRLLHIDLRHRTRSDEDVFADGLKSWLERSAPLAIPIILMLDNQSISHGILEELLRAAPRWRSLSLRFPNYTPNCTPYWFVSRLAESKLDSLEELGTLIFGQDVDLTALPSFTVPRLRKLEIEIFSKALPISLPWSQLTDLTLTSGYPKITLDILAQCSNLVKADVSTAGWNVLAKARQDILALSHLHALDFLFRDGRHCVPFLDCLSTPALEELSLDFGRREMDRLFWTAAHFTAFQLRAPNITQLGFQNSCLTSDDLKNVIHHAPSLTHLKLVYCRDCFDDALISALCYHDGMSPLAPHLQNLGLHDFGNNFTEANLARMIASRWWTDAELASRLDPPAVARWTRVELYGSLSRHFRDILRDLPSNVLATY